MIHRENLCLIPAKGASTRLPRKNLLPIDGIPLVGLCVQKALEVNLFDTVCVSTEDSEIADISKEYGAEVPFIRPEELSRDPSTIVDVMLHALEYYEGIGVEFEKITVLLPTAPLVLVDDIRMSVMEFRNKQPNAMLSVTETEFPPFNAWLIEPDNMALKPCFPDSEYKHTKSTECPKAYRSNGAILIVNVEYLKQNKGYQGAPILPFVMPQSRSIDIDTEYEYSLVRCLAESNQFTSQDNY